MNDDQVDARHHHRRSDCCVGAGLDHRCQHGVDVMGDARREIPPQERLAIKDAWNHTCAYCRKKITDSKDGHIDHIIPKSAGGECSLNNFALSCVQCNRDKSSKRLPRSYEGLMLTVAAKKAEKARSLMKLTRTNKKRLLDAFLVGLSNVIDQFKCEVDEAEIPIKLMVDGEVYSKSLNLKLRGFVYEKNNKGKYGAQGVAEAVMDIMSTYSGPAPSPEVTKEAARRCKVSNKTAQRAIRRCTDDGLIIRVSPQILMNAGDVLR